MLTTHKTPPSFSLGDAGSIRHLRSSQAKFVVRAPIPVALWSAFLSTMAAVDSIFNRVRCCKESLFMSIGIDYATAIFNSFYAPASILKEKDNRCLFKSRKFYFVNMGVLVGKKC